MIRSIRAIELREGMKILLPFNKTATVRGTPKIGRRYVTYVTEHGTSRVFMDAELEVEVAAELTLDVWAQAMSTGRLAADLEAIALHARARSPQQRAALLGEAARRLRECEAELRRRA